jgi:hypothetical protein
MNKLPVDPECKIGSAGLLPGHLLESRRQKDTAKMLQWRLCSTLDCIEQTF